MSRTLLLLSKVILVITCCFGLVRQAQAQTANSYTFTTGTGATLDAMSGAVSLIGINTDDTPVSAVTNIGFTFTYEGAAYTQFSVNPNGLMRLGATAVSGEWTNSITSTADVPKLMPFWDDQNTGSTGGVTTVLSGTSPNQIRVVQWKTTVGSSSGSAFTQTYQVWLYQTSNVVEFRYGTGNAGTSASVAIGGATASNYLSVTTSAQTASNAAVNDGNTAWPGSGRRYTFTPSVTGPCSSITALTCGVANSPTFASGTGVYNPPSTTCGFSTPGIEKVYSYTPSVTGNYTISQPTSFGYIDYFYKAASGGCSGTGWTCIDDISNANTGNANVNIALTAGTAYYFLLDPESTTGGSVTFTLNCPAALPGENCANAQNLALLTSPYSATTVGYTEDISICRTGAPDRIFFISVPNGSQLTIGESTNSYDEYEYVGYGATCPGNTTINCWDNDGLAQTTWLNNSGATQTVWYVQDAFTAGGTGTFTLQWSITAPPTCVGAPTAPTNGATGITASGTTLSWPSVAGATGYDVYFGTTNPAPTLVSSNQAGTTYATGVMSGSTPYFWRIEPRNALGAATGCTNWSFTTAAGAPLNDNCANAIVIASLPYTSAVINNALATSDTPTSSCDGPYKNVWWTVTGICGTMTAITCTGSTNFDDEISVFTSTGGCSGPWTQVACNDDNGAGCTSNFAGVSWTATAGTVYYITAGDYWSGGTSGNLQLNVTATPFTASVAPTGVSGSSSICTGGSTTLTATGGTLGTSGVVQWFTGSCGGTSAGTGPSITVSPSTTTTYYVRYSSTCNTTTCYAVTVVVNAQPTVTITPPTATICNGQSTTLTAAGFADFTLNGVLSSINASSATLLATIPTPSGFTDGNTGNSISDGCSDMYDGGNSINTNLAASIAYTNGVVTAAASSFGTGGQYFTRILGSNVCGSSPTMFVWAGDINGLTSLSITGNNGADGQGLQNTLSFTVSANGVTYTCLLKRVYNATDPSINQLFLIPTPNSASQTIGLTTDDSQQTISGISGVTRFYYLLYAGAGGALIDDAAAQNIAQTFVNVIPTASTYAWSPGGATTAAVTVSPTTTTTYTVTYNNGICSNTATRQVTVNPLPTASASGGGTVCSGQTLPNVTFTFTGTAPYNFTYNPGGVSVTGHNNNTYTITNAAAGTYAVTALADANCTGTSFGSSASVVVNPLPTATASGGGVVCADQPLPSVTFTFTGNAPYNFSYSGPGGTSVTGHNSNTYTITNAAAGSYQVTAVSDANCTGTSFGSSATVVVNALPVVTCGSYGPVCVDAADITLGGSPTGGTWSGTGVTGSTFDPSAGTQTVTYSYTDGNGCSASCSTTITVNQLPVVTCGSYGPVCVDAADITLGGSPSGGTWSGTGVTGNSFDPSAGTQTVTYNYSDGNGCSASCSTTITVNPLPVVTCGSYGPVCTDAADITLGGSPSGGTWSGTGVTGNSFDPSAGTQTVTYSYTDGNGCGASCSTTITVNPLPVVTCGSYGPVCTDAADISLGGSPVGGTWSGTGVTGSSFDPSAGTQTVTYSYTDGNGCSASCSTTITVNQLPVVTCGSYGPVCVDAADITLGGSPSGGTWSGTGVTGNSFDPSVGTRTITYGYTDGNGCSASCSTTITVNLLPNVTVAPNPGNVWNTGSLARSNSGGVGSDAISAQTVLTRAVGGPIYNSACQGAPGGGQGCAYTGPCNTLWAVGTIANWSTLNYQPLFQANGCLPTSMVGQTWVCHLVAENIYFQVQWTGYNSSGYSYIRTTGPSTASYCIGSPAIALTASGASTYSWSPATGLDATTGSTVNASPSGTTTYTVTGTDANGCSSSATTTITVFPLPVVTCGTYGPVCTDAADITLGGSPAGGSWSGTGVTGNSFDPSAGTQTLTYSYIDGHGCSSSCQTTITVNPLPVVTCGTYGPFCDNDAPIALGGSPSGGTWSGPGVDGSSFDPSVGTQTLTYTYSDGNACTSSCQTTIVVGTSTNWYVDADGDGAGDIDATPLVACAPQPGYSLNNTDECDNDPLKVETGTCGCGVAEIDTDSDTYADCIDGCPTDPLKQNPGACGCGVADADSDGDGYMNCMDGCPNDPNKIGPGVCGCGSPDVDSDGDTVLDCNDGCPNDASKLAPGTCGCGNPEPGAACNDNNANTINDVISAGCVCAGTGTTPIYSLDITTDANGTQTSWEIAPLGGGAALCSGSGYPSNTTSTAFCPLPDAGCYVLTVYDALADGMCCVSGNGGYVLRAPGGLRIIDAANSGIFTSSASVALGFCTPIGTDRLTDSRCDRVDYIPSDFVQAVPNAAVQAQYGTGNQTDDGYQFWFFNPNGGYSRRIMVTHANSNTVFPVGPDRCSYLRLNSIVTSPLPLNTFLNVRVRRQVNGVYAEFGPACRFKIDTELNCPTTQLVATPGSTFSCGITGVLLNGSRTIYAVPVPAANRYQFEFSKPGYLRKITMTTSSLLMTVWYTMPLQYNSTYNVRVRVSYDAGASFCPFGPVCTIATAATPPAAGAGDGREDAAVGSGTRDLTMWPNPNHEGRVRFSMHGLGEGAHAVSVDIFDIMGARVQSDQLNIDGEELNTVVDLHSSIAPGVYLVNLTVDGHLTTERLVVQ